MTGQPTLTAERLKQVLSYDGDYGKFTWIAGHLAGKRAGGVGSQGYIVIRVDGRLYRACRLAWLYVNGEWPPAQIDHRNLLRADDRWDNLRSATNSQNTMNKNLRPSGNYSGIKGVYWCKRGQKWLASIKLNGKNIYIGKFGDRELARAAYSAAAIKYHGEFARAA